MDVPRNHPGALAEIGFEHEPHDPTIILAQGPAAHARLENKQPGSTAHGLAKDVLLSCYESNVLTVDYTLPATLPGISVEFGSSPDYLNLLRRGRSILRSYDCAGVRGWTTETTAVWVKPEDCTSFQWTKPYQEEFGHGRAIRLSVAERQFGVSIGVETHRPNQTGG